MQYLNTFLGLLAKTESRDKILRLFQYATLHTEDSSDKGSLNNVYVQMRRTRKILRFLRTLEYVWRIRKDFSELTTLKGQFKTMTISILSIFQNLCTFFFYISDHRVFLGEMELISKENAVLCYPRSMKLYMFQNIFGSIKCLIQMLVIIMDGKYKGENIDMEKGAQLIRNKSIQFLRDILDIFVAVYYLKKPAGEAIRIGIVGIITSLIGIAQSLKII